MEPEQSRDVIDDDVINQQVLDGLAAVERYTDTSDDSLQTNSQLVEYVEQLFSTEPTTSGLFYNYIFL